MAKQKTARKAAEATTAVLDRPVITDDDLLPPSQEGSGPEEAPVAAVANPSQGVFITAKDLALIVAEVTKAQSQAGAQAIADSISKALTQHMGPRRLTVADIGEPKTPFNPTGRKREMLMEFIHNGYPIQERFASDGEIELLHQLTPGTYGPPDFPIVVILKKRLTGKSKLFIVHGDSKDDRLRMKNYAQNFYALLALLIQEAKDQLAQRKAEARALLADD